MRDTTLSVAPASAQFAGFNRPPHWPPCALMEKELCFTSLQAPLAGF